jgi:hypothetical protein
MLVKCRNCGEKHLTIFSIYSKQQKIEKQRVSEAAANNSNAEMAES